MAKEKVLLKKEAEQHAAYEALKKIWYREIKKG